MWRATRAGDAWKRPTAKIRTLVSRMGIAAVRGFQGDAKFRDKTRVIATLKHFAAHGQPESGMNCAPVERLRARAARDVPLHVQGSHPEGRRHQRDGVLQRDRRRAVARQPWLLRDVLRKEWGFKGFVVSDYYAIWELGYRPDTHGHFVAHRTRRRSCALAVQAGVNIELPDPDCYLHLVELVRKGVSEGISSSTSWLRPCCSGNFEMGLFDDPYVDPDEAERVVGCDAHRELALPRGPRSDHAAEERRRHSRRSI